MKRTASPGGAASQAKRRKNTPVKKTPSKSDSGDENDIPATIKVEPKKRGRPAKKLMSDEDDVLKPEPKKRGRPAKKFITDEDEVLKPEPKKRGRPPKKPVLVDDDASRQEITPKAVKAAPSTRALVAKPKTAAKFLSSSISQPKKVKATPSTSKPEKAKNDATKDVFGIEPRKIVLNKIWTKLKRAARKLGYMGEFEGLSSEDDGDEQGQHQTESEDEGHEQGLYQTEIMTIVNEIQGEVFREAIEKGQRLHEGWEALQLVAIWLRKIQQDDAGVERGSDSYKYMDCIKDGLVKDSKGNVVFNSRPERIQMNLFRDMALKAIVIGDKRVLDFIAHEYTGRFGDGDYDWAKHTFKADKVDGKDVNVYGEPLENEWYADDNE